MQCEEERILALMTSPTSAWLVVNVNGLDISFLCDSGACRTVIRKKDVKFPYELSKETIVMRSASGNLATECVTEPLRFLHDEETVEAQVIISENCPVSLLGRDVMTKLKLGVVLMGDGNWAAVHIRHKMQDNLVTQERGEPEYFYALQLKDGVGISRQELVTLAQKHMPGKEEFQGIEDLHCTMWYKQEGGSSHEYERRFKLGSSTRLTVQNIYWNDHCMGGKVLLQPADSMLHHGVVKPHISLAKSQTMTWKKVGEFVDKCTHTLDWEETQDRGMWYSPTTNAYFQSLNWVYQCERVRKMHSSHVKP